MGKRKAVERDLSGPSKMKRKNHKERAIWITKYALLGPQAIIDYGYDMNDDGLPLQRCVTCGEAKERTTDFFTAQNVYGDLEKWFSRPFPSMSNSPGRPCNACWAVKERKRMHDVEGDAWLWKIAKRYNLSIEWVKQQYTMPTGVQRCWATGGTLGYMKGSNAFSLGVNDTVIQTEGTYSQYNCHNIEDVVAVYRFANCRQTVDGANETKVVIIPSLRDAYTELYRRVSEALRVGRAEMENRGDVQAMKMKAKKDFSDMACNAKRRDTERGLVNNMSSVRVLETVRTQHAICSTTGVIMTSFSASGGFRGPFDVHMDRLDDGYSLEPKGHIATNIELKIRMLNNDYHITRKDFLLLFMNQTLLPVPDDVMAIARAEYDAIPCSARDEWKHSVEAL